MTRWTAMVHLAGAYFALSRIAAVQSPLGESANKPNVWPVANWELEQEAHKCRLGSKTNKVRTLHVSPAAVSTVADTMSMEAAKDMWPELCPILVVLPGQKQKCLEAL